MCPGFALVRGATCKAGGLCVHRTRGRRGELGVGMGLGVLPHPSFSRSPEGLGCTALGIFFLPKS